MREDGENRMVRQHRRKKRTYVIAGVCVIACLLGIAGGFAIAANNDNDDFSLTPESVHVKDSQIENSTLVIGSHLIYVGSMTDELYQIASDSANTFSQQDLYYKSELSGGTWYEITTATSIADISTSGSPVPKSVIEELEFTHYTKSDGRLTYPIHMILMRWKNFSRLSCSMRGSKTRTQKVRWMRKT